MAVKLSISLTDRTDRGVHRGPPLGGFASDAQGEVGHGVPCGDRSIVVADSSGAPIEGVRLRLVREGIAVECAVLSRDGSLALRTGRD